MFTQSFFNIQKSFNLQEQPLLKIYKKTKSSEVNVLWKDDLYFIFAPWLIKKKKEYTSYL